MKPIISVFCVLLLLCLHLQGQTLQQIQQKRVMLPNGWALTPTGKQVPLGDLPLNMVGSPSGKWLAVTNNGQSDQSLQIIDLSAGKVTDSMPVGKAYLGLAFSDDERSLYASGGNDNWIMHYNFKGGKLRPMDTIVMGAPWPERISPTGIALDDKKQVLYVVTKESNSLYLYHTGSKQLIARYPLGGEAYTCLLSPDRKMLYISCWGCDKLILFNTDKQTMEGNIPLGDNPNDMCLDKAGQYLYVCNANDNSVSVIDLKQRKVIETLNSALYPDAPNGSTTNGVALSPDNKTLYIANADNNCLAVFDVSSPGSSKSKGFIPTGWYPSCVRTLGNNILVANGKGLSSLANPQGPNPRSKAQEVSYQKSDAQAKKQKVQYIGGLFRGALSILPAPNADLLKSYSQVVYNNTPYSKKKELEAGCPDGNPIPGKVGAVSPIKHVFYIIKENRTYDQVLGDLPQGNGDTSLVLFGRKVTPNQHALAEEFVLLDNFYVNGEVSADGHNWSTAAYGTDFLEKNWPTAYGGRGGDYYGEGTRSIANNKNGFIWDLCKKYGVSYRTYGEFADDNKPNIPALEGHLCTYYTGWDESIRDTVRFRQWQQEFDSLVATKSLPQFNSLRFINDHTEGLRVGKPTPIAHVADNDLAVGLFVEHLSKSPIWNESVVFILEDDAQNGPDHVDAHRSTAYVAGGFVKRGYVDHTMYSTSSMLRTMELILGLPPMSQYDAAATPMWRCFADTSNPTGFKARPAEVDLGELNVAVNKWSIMSEGFNFAMEDRVPDAEFNQVIWVAVKGEDSPCPAPVHAAFFSPGSMDMDREDD
ncbi:MAG: bifunctional YncE family protein/alkaline phosphatase family protein [Chitinophagales bacterium]|nr:bifunctional YncE family protein/alkaline phosphatase family protein [Chitinophagales bacterium]